MVTPLIFSDLLHAIQAGNRISRTFVVRHAAAVSRKRDDIGNPRLRGERNIRTKAGFDFSVVLRPVERIGNLAAARIGHRADEAEPARNLILVGLQQIDSF